MAGETFTMKKKDEFTWLASRIKKRIPALVFMTLSNVGTSFMGVMFALGTKNVINSAVSGSREQLLESAFIQFLIILTWLVLATLYRYLHARLAAVLDRDWKTDLGTDIIYSDYSRISAYHTGELLNRMNNDVRIVNDGLLATLPGFAAMVTKLIAVVVVLLSLEPVFTLILAVLGLVLIALTGIARTYLKEMNKAVSTSEGKVSGFFQEVFEKLIIVQSMNVEDEIISRGDKLMEERYGLQRKRFAVSVTANTGVSALSLISGFAALLWCAFRLGAGTMSFGELTAVTQLVSQLQSPFVNLSGILPKYIAMSAACERLMELEDNCKVEESGEEEKEVSYESLKNIKGEHIHFSYGRDKVLEDFSFTIPKNSFTVVTGPSGIGKSTVLKLLLGIFRNDQGRIFFETEEEDIPVTRTTRKLFAYVPQGNLLFSGTLKENLLLTNPDADEQEIEEAVNLSCMSDYVSQLPDGLETVIGENARGLSEGQAQRLSIGRAILSGAPVILLDEATSALDADTERRVLENLKHIEGKTCVAVTHRPAAAELADNRIDFKKGN